MPQRQPTPIFVPFIDTGTLRDITVSNLDQILFSPTDGTVPTDPNIPQVISNLNSMPFYSAADLTLYDVTTQWTPMSSGHVTKMFINIAVAAEMPTHTDDDVTLETISIQITEQGTNKVLFLQTYDSGITIFNAALEERMFIIRQSVDNQSLEVSQGVPVNIRITSTLTIETGNTAPTFFMGVSPFFPLTADTISKMFSSSGVVFYLDRSRDQGVPK